MNGPWPHNGIGYQFSNGHTRALMAKLNRGGTNGPLVLGHSARGGGLADDPTGGIDR